jgi:hypothetical protein
MARSQIEGKGCTDRRCHPGSPSTLHRRAAGREKADADPAGGTGGLDITASSRAGPDDRARVRGTRRSGRRADLASLRRDPRHTRRLSRARRSLAAAAANGVASMKATTRRSLRRVWRAMSWPLPGHLVFALATGVASGATAAHYPDVISPPYAAILGAVILYPLMLTIWWRLHRFKGKQ